MSKATASANYNSENVKVLKGLDGIRKRPTMYVGDTDSKGIFHLFKEIADNSIDEAMEGHCDEIFIIIKEDGEVTVTDNGRGMPIDMHEGEGKCAAIVLLTNIHAGGKFDEDSYQYSGGMHGVGAKAVNALSDFMELVVKKGGKVNKLFFDYGTETTEMPEILGDCDMNDTGTSVRYRPIESIFSDAMREGGLVPNLELLTKFCKDKASLTSGLRINLDFKGEFKETYFSENGIADLLDLPPLDEKSGHLQEQPIFFKDLYVHKDKRPDPDFKNKGSFITVDEKIETEIVLFFFNKFSNPEVRSFVNNLETTSHGKHFDGMRTTLFEVVSNYSKKKLKNKANFTSEDVMVGGHFIVSQKMEEPQFTSQTKEKLSSHKGATASKHALKEALERHLDTNPAFAEKLVQKCIDAAISREKAEQARHNAEKEAIKLTGNLSGKLAACESTDLRVNELILVEGDSAGGSAKQGRCRKTQAVLPLRGKVLNTQKADIADIVVSEQIQNLYTAVGTSIDHEYDYNKLRYGKIIIMCDADVDGGHIEVLLLTLFYKYMPDLIRRGHIYIAVPPLYKVDSKGGSGKTMYFKNDEELEERFPNGVPARYTKSRFKGLGEMTPAQLQETTMSKENRKLMRVQYDESMKQEADELFDVLMGNDVPPRREFIEINANFSEAD
ncbi:type IIA DNA topoisomerase subunit B [Vibrio sp. D431a]|uniref:DNA gyrase/topoisomerase IV subunit B n=1 Tax=Vibrio sp. D431a TaxID=2837388 RepID=UPI002552395F|nr:type IIA DNA topoisomerase subunit B [Vibrio sp. D431a]MDK9793875.1 type IIA DNA topoisomerase subunit B [Vibrio sp. D431a]